MKSRLLPHGGDWSIKGRDAADTQGPLHHSVYVELSEIAAGGRARANVLPTQELVDRLGGLGTSSGVKLFAQSCFLNPTTAALVATRNF